jgi:hypothetical protein
MPETIADPSYRNVMFRLPTPLACELDRAASVTMGTVAAYMRRALLDQLQRDGFRSAAERVAKTK